jgi:pimeloyl-ACP methyl ester carboxylesterase
MSRSRGRGLVIGAVLLAVMIGVVVWVVVGRSDSPVSAPADPGSGESAQFGAVGTTETVPCPESLAAGAAFVQAGNEVEGETYSCGVVVVPETHDQPDGRTIELFYLKLHSHADKPAATPMIYLAGGPGGSGSYELTANTLLNQNLDRIRQTRDIIAYDQRGTGYSNYLLCAPFESTLGILQDRDRNPEIAQAIEDLQDTTLGVGYGALRSNLCAVGTKLLADVDLTQYNSVSSAQDLPMVVQALGYADGYSLYGTSYGTRLAQEAMRTDPEGVRAVILDGVTGPSIPNSMWSSTKPVAPYVEIFAQCAADAACNEAYPNLADRFGALLEKLEDQPLVFDPPLVLLPALGVAFPPVLTQIDADFFRNLATINNIAVGGGFAAQVPQMIVAAEQGDSDYFRTTKLAATEADTGGQAPQTTDPTGGGGTLPIEFDQPLFEVPFVTLLSIAQNAAGQQQATLDGQWLTVALGDLAVRLAQGEDQADLMEALLRLAAVPNRGTSSEELIAYANGNMSPESATAANAIAEQMTRNDVRATMWGIQDVAMVLGTQPDQRAYSAGMQNAFNCSDELAFTSIEVAEADVAQTPYPQLVAFPVEANQQTLLTCLSYPTVLDESVTEPVDSDIPALLYLGPLDNETPVGWGREVAKGLTRSTVVEWNNQGHVAAAKDPEFCPGDIAAAFLDDPTKEPDLTCSESDTYDLEFVLPSE